MDYLEEYAYQLFKRIKDKYDIYDYYESDDYYEYVMSNDNLTISVVSDLSYSVGVRLIFPWRKEDNSCISFEVYGQSVDYVVKWIDKVCQIVKPLLLSARL